MGMFRNLKYEVFSKEVPMSDYIESCVDVEYFEKCCSVCPNYGKTWSCPPYDFNPLDIWNSYKTFYIYAIKVTTPEEVLNEEYSNEDLMRIGGEILKEAHKRVDKEMEQLKGAFEGSKILGGGSCRLCGENKCARLFGNPCRFPDKMTYSIESIGGNVEITLKKYLDQQICWGKDGHLAPYYMAVGGLMKK